MDAVEVSGLRIAYRRRGDGPPLVLVHGGLGLDGRSWQGQLDALADEFTVVAWDAPGCGASTDPPRSYRMRDYADRLAEFIDALGLERPHLLGISWGGTLVLELYARHPGIPRTLVLAGAYAGWAGSLAPDVVRDRVRRMEAEMDLPPERWVPGYVPAMLSEAAPQALVERVTGLMGHVRPAAGHAMLHAMAETDVRDVLPAIRVPTLVIHGELDSRSPLAVAEELHRRIPGSELAVLEGVGHLCSIEAPDEFDAAVRAFLRRAGAAGP